MRYAESQSTHWLMHVSVGHLTCIVALTSFHCHFCVGWASREKAWKREFKKKGYNSKCAFLYSDFQDGNS